MSRQEKMAGVMKKVIFCLIALFLFVTDTISNKQE
jgi:hypothetical protein